VQRGYVYRRDRGKCALCGHVGYWEMDHIIPISEGGILAPGMTIAQAMANLRTLCRACHKSETRKLAKRLAEKRKSA
jgi:5-methylcytosine-specific restriction endonuclease McrA